MADAKPKAPGGAAGAKKKKSARHKSAVIRVRRNARRAAINKMRLTEVRNALRSVEAAIGAGDHAKARDAFKAAQPVLHRGAQKGVMDRNTISRRLSRLNARVKALAA